VILGVALFFWLRRAPEARAYQLSAARRGDLTVTVTATGVLAPLDTVYVGTEVSGVIDLVTADYNDRVVKGQVLAVVNTDQLRAQIQQSRASLAVARAAEKQAAATLAEVLPQAARAESLFERTMISPQDVESARAARVRAEAAHASAIAQVAGAEAALDVQQTALRKATIRAPIRGIVLERDVERGRTVTAAFQTPVLFVLAADLAHMTLSLDIDEADIGQVGVGQTAEFSVDAYPDRVFTARVRSVRNAAKTVEGVVTYQAILDVANPELLLRPGMTATARIATARVANALLVANAALRFTPEAETENAEAASAVPGEAAPAATGRGRRVWTVRDGELTAIPITVGLTDGQWTEVTVGDLSPGTRLVVGVAGESSAAAGSAQASTAEGHPPVLMGGRRGR
jgi:HlyD family secretion protein